MGDLKDFKSDRISNYALFFGRLHTQRFADLTIRELTTVQADELLTATALRLFGKCHPLPVALGILCPEANRQLLSRDWSAASKQLWC